MSRRTVVLVSGVLVAVTALAGCGSSGGGAAVKDSSVAVRYQGALLSKPIEPPATSLRDTDGARYDFATRDRGLLRLVFFGFTHCEDTCPTTMSDLAVALRKVPSAVREKTRVVFVTTDPKRDSAPVIRTWLDRFDRSFIGVGGTMAQIDAAAKAMGVPLLPDEKLPDGGYDVPHGAQVIAFTPDNQAHLIWLGGTQVKQYSSDIQKLLGDPAFGGKK